MAGLRARKEPHDEINSSSERETERERIAVRKYSVQAVALATIAYLPTEYIGLYSTYYTYHIIIIHAVLS